MDDRRRAKSGSKEETRISEKKEGSMTIQEAARTAIEVQNAINLSGVLASFKEIVHEVIWPEARRLGKGTEWVNTHPIVAIFLSKLVDLNRNQDFSQAYDAVKKLAEQPETIQPETEGIAYA
jgi:hypothetical protein